MNAQARLSGSLGLSALPHVNEFIKFSKLLLSLNMINFQQNQINMFISHYIYIQMANSK